MFKFFRKRTRKPNFYDALCDLEKAAEQALRDADERMGDRPFGEEILAVRALEALRQEIRGVSRDYIRNANRRHAWSNLGK